MSGPSDPVDPTGKPDVSAAARRAREQLHEEITQVRVGIEEILAADAAAGGTRSLFGESLGEKARGTTIAMAGLIAAVSLALALQQTKSMLTGSFGPLRSSGGDAGQKIGAVGGAQPVAIERTVGAETGRARRSEAHDILVTAPLGTSNLPPTFRFVVGAPVPIAHSHERPPRQRPGHKPRPRPENPTPTPPAPVTNPDTTVLTGTPPAEPAENTGGDGGAGPISSGGPGPGSGGDTGHPGKGHGGGSSPGNSGKPAKAPKPPKPVKASKPPKPAPPPPPAPPSNGPPAWAPPSSPPGHENDTTPPGNSENAPGHNK